jgi:hypothetical protein
MKTALRVAVEGFMMLPQQRVTPEQVAEAAPVTLRAVRGYLHRLCTQRILIVVRNTSNVYTAGPRLRRWLTTEPATRPGGNASQYLTAKAERDALIMQENALIRAAQLRRRLYGEDE